MLTWQDLRQCVEAINVELAKAKGVNHGATDMLIFAAFEALKLGFIYEMLNEPKEKGAMFDAMLELSDEVTVRINRMRTLSTTALDLDELPHRAKLVALCRYAGLIKLPLGDSDALCRRIALLEPRSLADAR